MGHRFSPWSGKIPHAAEQSCEPQPLKPTCLEACASKRSHHSEKPVHRNQRVAPPNTARRSLLVATKTQGNHQQIKIKNYKKKQSKSVSDWKPRPEMGRRVGFRGVTEEMESFHPSLTHSQSLQWWGDLSSAPGCQCWTRGSPFPKAWSELWTENQNWVPVTETNYKAQL